MKKSIHTVLSPALWHLYDSNDKNIVVIDILRATSTICYALSNGALSIKPVLNVEELSAYKEKNYLCAAERNGSIVPGFDIGNSPFSYSRAVVESRKIALTTTNGTKCIQLAKNGKKVYVGSFLNLSALTNILIKENDDILIFCAGWKDKFNLEDTLFAGALIKKLANHFLVNCDSSLAAIDLYNNASSNLSAYIKKSAHAQRFERLGIDKDIDFCMSIDTLNVVPYLNNYDEIVV